jgi:predicted nuclease of predicted toxin-antitoxin system
MNILADEGIDKQIIDFLRRSGHSVIYIAEIEPSIEDNLVFDRANDAAAILLTADKDFGEIVFRDNRLVSDGVILIRLSGLSPDMKATIVTDAVSKGPDEFMNRFSVISPGKIRHRAKEA